MLSHALVASAIICAACICVGCICVGCVRAACSCADFHRVDCTCNAFILTSPTTAGLHLAFRSVAEGFHAVCGTCVARFLSLEFSNCCLRGHHAFSAGVAIEATITIHYPFSSFMKCSVFILHVHQRQLPKDQHSHGQTAKLWQHHRHQWGPRYSRRPWRATTKLDTRINAEVAKEL